MVLFFSDECLERLGGDFQHNEFHKTLNALLKRNESECDEYLEK